MSNPQINNIKLEFESYEFYSNKTKSDKVEFLYAPQDRRYIMKVILNEDNLLIKIFDRFTSRVCLSEKHKNKDVYDKVKKVFHYYDRKDIQLANFKIDNKNSSIILI